MHMHMMLGRLGSRKQGGQRDSPADICSDTMAWVAMNICGAYAVLPAVMCRVYTVPRPVHVQRMRCATRTVHVRCMRSATRTVHV